MIVRRSVLRHPGGPDDDALAVEEPLEIRVDGEALAVTLRTPGEDLDLAAGFLATEGVIDGPDDLAALAHVDLPGDRRGNTVDCRLAAGTASQAAALRRARRELFATSSCGVCGKASIDRLRVGAAPLPPVTPPPPGVLLGLPAQLRDHQATFCRTGGVHAAALFTLDGELELVREDVGRHNAVDKVIGARLRADRYPVDDRVLLVSGRVGFEIVQKAWVARIPMIAAVGAPTALAVDLAVAAGMALVGFLRDERFNRYS
jgi:FdhD protein